MILKKHIWLLVLSILGLAAVPYAVSPARAQNPANIGLLQFIAVPVEAGIRLQWDVESELGTVGYTIKRGENGSFEYLPDPEGNGNLFILAEGGPAQAYSYAVLDDAAVKERTYTYRLIEIMGSSSEHDQAEVTVTFHIEPTSTPITFSGDLGTPGSGGSQGPTATAQAQEAPTNAPPPTVVAPTPLPSATAAAAATNPVNNSQAAPAANSSPVSPQPAVGEEPREIGSDTVESSPVLQDSDPQEQVSEIAANSSPGVAVALEVGADEQFALDNDQTLVQSGETSPVVIGVAGSKESKSQHRSEARQQIADEEPVNANSSRILLWLAFIVALLIFSASVVGAILLYSRRRPLK